MFKVQGSLVRSESSRFATAPKFVGEICSQGPLVR
jgi:hypothetical protein